jgi:hypothetical protein
MMTVICSLILAALACIAGAWRHAIRELADREEGPR